MLQQQKWVERKFDLGQPIGVLPMILERLRGTSVRIAHYAAHLTEEQLSYKPEGAWSIKEHTGHLSDLEALHDGRINDFLHGKSILRAADMKNTKTYEAKHNETEFKKLLQDFIKVRKDFIRRLESLNAEVLERSALHPRLQVQMRPQDMALFTAEHDDHHLVIIHSIAKRFDPALI